MNLEQQMAVLANNLAEVTSMLAERMNRMERVVNAHSQDIPKIAKAVNEITAVIHAAAEEAQKKGPPEGDPVESDQANPGQ